MVPTWSFKAGFTVFTHWTSYFQTEFKFHWLRVCCILGKVLAHTCTRKAFEKIAKLKLGKDRLGCSCPIWSLLSGSFHVIVNIHFSKSKFNENNLYCVSYLTSETQMVKQSKQTEPTQHANIVESNITVLSSTDYCETCHYLHVSLRLLHSHCYLP